jgi:glycosyltransferase involved in cell wall biosynthesis
MSQLSLAILQRVLPSYRMELFRRLAARSDLRVRVFIGDDLPETKVRSGDDIDDLDVVKLPTRWLRAAGRVLPLQRGLGRALREFDPDVILSEGESHLLGFLTGAWVRGRRRDCALVHWGLGGLPGDDPSARIENRFKRPIQNLADAFVAYSSYGAEALARIGHRPEKIVVAVNVSDTDRHLRAADALGESRSEARSALGLPDVFTVISVGAVEISKRVEVLVDAVAGTDGVAGTEGVNALIVGGGGELEALRGLVRERGQGNVFLTGPVSPSALARYYRAADALALPGRGGMVISEAMAHSLPVIVHLADGTEFDLVRDRETGVRLTSGEPSDFRRAIERLAHDPEDAARLGAAGRRLIENEINTNAMVERIVEACRLAQSQRSATPSR